MSESSDEPVMVVRPVFIRDEPEPVTVVRPVFIGPEPEPVMVVRPVFTGATPMAEELPGSASGAAPDLLRPVMAHATSEPITRPEPARSSPWLTAASAAKYAGTGRRLIYREVKAGRLRAAVLGDRRDLRIHRDWVDGWLTASASDKPTGKASR